MDASNVITCSEYNAIQKVQSEGIVVTNTLGKRRRATSSSLTDDSVIKKIKTDCDKPDSDEERDDENVSKPVKTSPTNETGIQITKTEYDKPETNLRDINHAENIPQPVTISPSLINEPGLDIKKTNSDCNKPETEGENAEENILLPMKRREEAIKFPKLYRLLHDNEDISKGLSAKSVNARKDVATHVATGSNRGYSSQYISTCASLYKAESFRSLKLNSGYKWGMKHIAEIDVASLPENLTIIDLSTNILRKKYETNDKEVNEKLHKFAESHQEVLLVGTVPTSCLKLIEFTGVVPDSDNSCSDSDDFGFRGFKETGSVAYFLDKIDAGNFSD